MLLACGRCLKHSFNTILFPAIVDLSCDRPSSKIASKELALVRGNAGTKQSKLTSALWILWLMHVFLFEIAVPSLRVHINIIQQAVEPATPSENKIMQCNEMKELR
jgi:hypothetical protein